MKTSPLVTGLDLDCYKMTFASLLRVLSGLYDNIIVGLGLYIFTSNIIDVPRPEQKVLNVVGEVEIHLRESVCVQDQRNET